MPESLLDVLVPPSACVRGGKLTIPAFEHLMGGIMCGLAAYLTHTERSAAQLQPILKISARWVHFRCFRRLATPGRALKTRFKNFAGASPRTPIPITLTLQTGALQLSATSRHPEMASFLAGIGQNLHNSAEYTH